MGKLLFKIVFLITMLSSCGYDFDIKEVEKGIDYCKEYGGAHELKTMDSLVLVTCLHREKSYGLKRKQ